MVERKKPDAELRNYYTVFLQIGLLATLVLFIVAVKVDWRSEAPEEYVMEEQELIEMEEIIQTEHIETPPPPPRPPVPQEVPDDEIIDDDIDMSMFDQDGFGDEFELPPPPEEDDQEEQIFTVVEHMPEPIGGMDGIRARINYPEMAVRAGIEGTVHVQFIVTEDGEVENPRVVRGIGGGADQEAIRVVQETQFRPGLQRGRPVRVQFTLPISFQLQN